jgi:hypothetical protein
MAPSREGQSENGMLASFDKHQLADALTATTASDTMNADRNILRAALTVRIR